MHTFEKIGHRFLRLAGFPTANQAKASSPVAFLTLGGSISLVALVSGCASPGPPLPPSLKLPKIVSNLTAERIGDQVVLRWTTPDQTTDGLDIQGPVTADICRDLPAAPPTPAPANSQSKPSACYAVLHRAVQAGASEAIDDLSTALPSPLNAGLTRLLAYRVQLRNAAGRTAGPSAIAYSVSGASLPPVQELHIQATKAGALLEWRREPAFGWGNIAAEPAFIAMDRTALTPSLPNPPPLGTNPAPIAKPKSLPELHLSVPIAAQTGPFGNTDPGGATDPTALVGQTYRYTVQRVRTVAVGGRVLELRSIVSPPVTVTMADIFPPDAPTGLVAVPGFLAPEANRNPSPSPVPALTKPTIDLSWQPSTGDRIAGYRVYRSEIQSGRGEVQGAQQGASTPPSRMTPSLVLTSSYRDATVEAGHTYLYRVTAVDTTGNESPPSAPATEAASAQ